MFRLKCKETDKGCVWEATVDGVTYNQGATLADLYDENGAIKPDTLHAVGLSFRMAFLKEGWVLLARDLTDNHYLNAWIVRERLDG